MLADWYLCATQGLSLPGTDAYLDALRALDEPAERVELADEAINQLRRVEPGLMLYALPRVLAAYRRHADRLSLTGRTAAYLAELDELAGGHPELRAAFDALADSPRRLRARIVALAEVVAADPADAETAEAPGPAAVPDPYDDLFSAPLATAAVALAAELAARSAETAREWLGDGEPELLAAALEGRYGRLPFLLAVRFSALTDGTAENRQRLLARLWAFGRGAADLEPDLVQEAAGLSRAQASEVTETLTEAVAGLDLAAWRKNEPGLDPQRRKIAQARWGGSGAPGAAATAAVLWQVAMWRVAAERDPAATLVGLRTWWAAPTLVERSRKTADLIVPFTVPHGEKGYEAAWNNLSTLARVRSWDQRRQPPRLQLTDGPVTATPAASASLVGSPWLLRAVQRWRASAERGAYPDWNDPPSLIRLSAAATLATDLLAAVPPGSAEDADHLLALLLLIRDTAVCSPLRDAINPHAAGDSPLPGALVALYHHALMVADRCGKGHGPHAVPRRIVRLLSEGRAARARCDAEPTQWARLMIFAAPMAAFWWLRETVSGGWPEESEDEDGWLTGTAPTPAARLLRLLLAERLDFDSGQRAAPALLERDLRPDSRHATGWDWRPQEEPDWDWLSNAETYGLTPPGGDAAEQPRTRHVNANVLLLAPRHGLDEWRWWSTRLVKALGDEPAPMALQTVRLEALLHSPAEADWADDWADDWAKSVLRRVEPRELARIVRRRMIDLLRAPIDGDESEKQVARVGEIVIDAILDLSRAAQWYHQLLLRELTRVAAPPSLATQWRYRAVGTLYRLGTEPAGRGAISPYEVVGQRVSAGLTANDVRGLLFQHGGAPIVGQAAALGETVERLWRDLRTGPPVRRVETPLSDLDLARARADDLTTVAVQLDRYHGTLVSYHDSRDGIFDAFTQRDRVAAVTSALLAGADGYGIVCAVDQPARTVWVNAGLGYPARHKLANRDRMPGLGDLVVAHFAGTPGAPVVDRALAPIDRPLDTAEVREATVRPLAGAPWLAVEIGGTDVYPGLGATDERDRAARWRWDPDLARRYGPPGEPVETCACWDETIERWVPLDRGGRELIAGERAAFADGLRLVLAEQVTEDEQTRLRFVTRPGRAYLLGADDFAPHDWSRLLGLIGDGRPGLAVAVRPADPDGLLVLLDEVDERNRDWLRIFDEPEDSEVAVHTAVWSSAGWHLRVEPPAGFPAEIAVTGLGGSAENALCVVREWGEPQARAATVAAERMADRGVPRPTEASEVRWHALAHLPKDSRVRLQRIVAGNLRKASLLGITRAGLGIFVATESVSLAADPATIHRFGRDREVIVESDRVNEPVPQRDPVAVPDDQLLRLSAAAGLEAVLAGADALDGMVVQQVLDTEKRIIQYGLWLRNGNRVGHAMVPEPTLSALKAEVGDHIDFRRATTGWIGHVRRRQIRGLALYTGVAEVGPGWLPVGEVERDGRPYTVYQAPEAPQLATGKAAERVTERHTVSRLDNRSWSYNSQAYVRVLVERGNRTYVGEAREFPAGSLMRVRSTDLRLTQHPGDDNPRYAVRRTFGLEAVIKQPPRPAASAEIELDRWERALRDGHQHMVGTRDGDRLLLSGYRAPLPDGTLARWLPLRLDELPLVDGQAYDDGSVRALIEDVDAGHVASFARATPLDVAGFAAALSLPIDDTRTDLPDPLYYVGAEPGHHRFEWGFGWTVDVPVEALTIDGEPAGSRLFHGDRVRTVRLVHDPALPGKIGLRLAGRDVATALSGRLMRESAAGMIHRIQVEVDLVHGRVAVLGVHTQRQGASSDRIEVAAHPIRAELAPADAEAVVARERKSGRSGKVTRQLHARLDTSEAARQGRRKMFTLIDPARLAEGDLLYARADRIIDTGNELCLELHPLGSAGQKWTFSVARRQFSAQVGLLARQLRSPGGANAYRGRQFMVRLVRKAPNRRDRWHGSIVDTPARPTATLASWVRQQGAACFAVLGRDDRLEVGPGLFYDAAGVPGARRLAPGTLLRLLAGGAGEPLQLEIAIPADLRYVRDGRPALALPKNSMLGPGGLGQARNGNAFTLADLPAIEARPDRGLNVRSLLQTAHPKIVYAVSPAPDDHARLRSIDPGTVVGTLEFDPAGPARLHPVGGGEPRALPWAQLSFAEGGRAELARRLRDGTWEYHDATTGHWDADGRECRRQELGQGNAERWPVFFADRGGPTLRYPRNQLLRLGLPAAELLDRPIRGRDEETYVVADATTLDDIPALWLELSPGRVAEVPVALFASRRQSLADLDWSQMHGGDLVTVRRRRNEQTGHVTLELRDWTPGLRGAWPGSPGIVLPVVATDRAAGALQLGAGGHTRWYPAEPELLDRYPVGSRVRLTSANRLGAGTVRTDDSVLLVPRDGGWGLAGFGDVEVTLAGDGPTPWPGAAWLRDLLAGPAAASGLLKALGGALPVTVDELGRSGERLTVTVSRRNQPSGRWPRRRIVRTEAVTSVRGSLVLRAGHALYLIAADKAVPGLDSSAVAAAATALRDRGAVLWWHHEQDELRPGTSAGTGHAEQAVLIEAPIEVDGQFLGLIGRNTETGALGWLPSRLASWIGEPDPRLPGLLAGPAPIPMVRERQQFSVVDRPAAAREHRLTEVGGVLSVVVAALPAAGLPGYLVRTAYTGVLLTLTAASGLALGQRLRAEVTAVRGGRFPQIVAVPAGDRRAELDLPRTIAERLAAIHATADERLAAVHAGSPAGDWDQPFRNYRAANLAADCPADPAAAVVWSAAHRADPGVLARWLAAGGREALAGRADQHLAPLLAACQVAAELGESDARAATLAVLIAHQIGRRAIRSLHVEPLVTHWLAQPERQTEPGLWAQIKRLELAPEMPPDRLTTVVQRCQAILARPVLHGREDLRAPVAHALLVATGSPARVERFGDRANWQPDAPLLSELAALGRGLTPPAGRPVAQPALLPPQRQVVNRAAREVIGQALPVILLPTLSAPPAQWQTLLDTDGP